LSLLQNVQIGSEDHPASYSIDTGSSFRGSFFSMAQQPLGDLGLLIFRGFTITLLDTPQSVGLLWTSDQLVADTST
jgi:hypothetical protein